MTEELTVSRRAELVEAEVDGELVALHVHEGTCYGFNATATRVWNLIERPKTVAELRDALLGEFEVDPETCERQLMDLLRDLESDGLIELSAAPAP